MMTSTQVIETSVNVITNSPSPDYTLARTVIIYRLINGYVPSTGNVHDKLVESVKYLTRVRATTTDFLSAVLQLCFPCSSPQTSTAYG